MRAINLEGWTVERLIETLERSSGPSDYWDRYIAALTNYCHDVTHVPPFTASIDCAIDLVRRVLPGWTWKVGTCCVSDDAWVAPDFNSPTYGDSLKRQFPNAVAGSVFDTGVDIDLRPAGRPAIALCIAVLTARRAIKAHQQQGEGE